MTSLGRLHDLARDAIRRPPWKSAGGAYQFYPYDPGLYGSLFAGVVKSQGEVQVTENLSPGASLAQSRRLARVHSGAVGVPAKFELHSTYSTAAATARHLRVIITAAITTAASSTYAVGPGATDATV